MVLIPQIEILPIVAVEAGGEAHRENRLVQNGTVCHIMRGAVSLSISY